MELMFKPFSTNLFSGVWVIRTEPCHSRCSHLHTFNCIQKFLIWYPVFQSILKVRCASAMVPRISLSVWDSRFLIVAVWEIQIFRDVSLCQANSYWHFEWTGQLGWEQMLGLLDHECDGNTWHQCHIPDNGIFKWFITWSSLYASQQADSVLSAPLLLVSDSDISSPPVCEAQPFT